MYFIVLQTCVEFCLNECVGQPWLFVQTTVEGKLRKKRRIKKDE